MNKVSFLVAGAQKCGTTALHGYLCSHPQLSMSKRKETHFFDDESLDWRQPDYERLHRHFHDSDSGRLRGESTPITLYWTPSHERISRYNPDMKFIFLFRDPALRAFSHWRMETGRGWEELDFATAIREGRKRITTDTAPEMAPGQRHAQRGEAASLSRVYSYIERGLYAGQLATLRERFPESNMLFLKSEDLLTCPEGTLHRVCDFLGIGHFDNVGFVRHNVGRTAEKHEDMTKADFELMKEIFRHDLQEFSRMTQLDISNWPTLLP